MTGPAGHDARVSPVSVKPVAPLVLCRRQPTVIYQQTGAAIITQVANRPTQVAVCIPLAHELWRRAPASGHGQFIYIDVQCPGEKRDDDHKLGQFPYCCFVLEQLSVSFEFLRCDSSPGATPDAFLGVSASRYRFWAALPVEPFSIKIRRPGR